MRSRWSFGSAQSLHAAVLVFSRYIRQLYHKTTPTLRRPSCTHTAVGYRQPELMSLHEAFLQQGVYIITLVHECVDHTAAVAHQAPSNINSTCLVYVSYYTPIKKTLELKSRRTDGCASENRQGIGPPLNVRRTGGGSCQKGLPESEFTMFSQVS